MSSEPGELVSPDRGELVSRNHGTTGRLAALIAVCLPAFLALIVWHPLLRTALLGWDSYPLILAARADGPGELVASLRAELMDGHYPHGRFYRPLVHLSFALDHALWGLTPFGYHLSDLVLLAACSAAVAGLGLVLIPGKGAAVGACLAGIAYALHPLQLEILPIAPRRADALATLFTLLALRSQARCGATRRGPCYAAGAWCFLAAASKETGAVAAFSATALALASAIGSTKNLRALAREALRACSPAWIALASFAALRTAVLSGLGGSARSSLSGLSSFVDVLVRYSREVLAPPSHPPLFLASIAVAAAIAIAWLRPGTLRAHLPSCARVFAFLGIWLFLLVSITSFSGYERDWYALPFLPIYALALGTLLALALHAVKALRALHIWGLAWTLALALIPLLLISMHTVQTCARTDFAFFEQASELSRGFLRRFDSAVAAASPGERIELRGLPAERQAYREGEPGRKILILAPYSLEAYAELSMPLKRVRVEAQGRQSERPDDPSAVLVVVKP